MLGWLRTLILYRLLGGRIVLALTALAWLWRRLRGGDARGNGPEARAAGRENLRASVSRARRGGA